MGALVNPVVGASSAAMLLTVELLMSHGGVSDSDHIRVDPRSGDVVCTAAAPLPRMTT